MIIAFQRAVGTASISMIIDDDWPTLKLRMCEAWPVERHFDRHGVWQRLRNHQIVLLEGEFYQVWDCHAKGDYADELFQGRHVEVIIDEDPE